MHVLKLLQVPLTNQRPEKEGIKTALELGVLPVTVDQPKT